MSYILDALKKSEQERGHGSVPGVQTIHSSSLNYHNDKKPVWPFLLFVLVFINISVLVYFIFSKQQPEIISTAQTETVNNTVTDSETIINNLNTTQERPASSIALINSQQNDLPPQNTKTEETSHNTTTIALPVKQESTIEQTTKVISLHDMPLNIRQHIPAMEFSAHIYSTTASRRSMMINGRFMEEGDLVADDLILNEITIDGAIFDFQGHRFSASVLSGWDVN